MSYTAGTIIYAKVKGFPWWPARIEAESSLPSNVLARRPKGTKPVYGVREALDPSSFDDPMEEDAGNEELAPDNDAEMTEANDNQNETTENDAKPKARGRGTNKSKKIAPPTPARTTERRTKSKRKTRDYSSGEDDAVSRDIKIGKKRRTNYASNRDSSSKPKQKQNERSDYEDEKMDIDDGEEVVIDSGEAKTNNDGKTKGDVKTEDVAKTGSEVKTDGDIKTDTEVMTKGDVKINTDDGAKADNGETQTDIEPKIEVGAKKERRRQTKQTTTTRKDTEASNLGVSTRSTRRRLQENNSSISAENSSSNSESNTASNSADNPSSNTADNSSLNTVADSSSIPAANSSSISSENSSSISATNSSLISAENASSNSDVNSSLVSASNSASGSDQRHAGDEITAEEKNSDNKGNKVENEGPSRSTKSRTKSPAERLKHLRHRIQRLMFSPVSEESDKTKVDEVLTEIENFPITIPLLKETKIGKVMRKIAELKIEPDPCDITQRSDELIKKWKGLLENNPIQDEDETSPAEEENVASTLLEVSLVMTVKDYFAKQDYKFYITASATLVLAGHKSTNRTKKNRSTGTSETSSTAGRDRTVKNREEEAEIEEFEKYNAEQINALPKEKRKSASLLLKSRGNDAFGHQNYDTAIRLYTQALVFNEDPIFYNNRAACYYNKNEFNKVIEDCNNALQMDPYYVKALNRRAMAYEQTSCYEESLHDYTAACIIDEFKNENTAASIDRLLKKVARIKAQEIIKNRIKRLPSTKFISLYLDSFRKETEKDEKGGSDEHDDFFKLAEKLMKQQRYQEAMKAYEDAINLDCKNLAKALNMRGTFTYLMGDSQNALVDFQKALELKPDYVQIYVKRATIYMEQGNKDGAWEEFEEAIKIDPTDPDIYYHRGQAVKEYQRRIELDSDFVFAYIQLSIAQYKNGSIPEGMKTFQKGLQKFPKSAEMYNYYGEMLADQRRLDEAMEQFDKAADLQQENFALPFVNKAMLCFHVKGDPAQAEEICRRALEIEPESDIANTIMSEILLARGNLELALRYLEKYQEVARTEAELQGILEYAEAARSHITFKERYPQLADRLDIYSEQFT
ncbi:10982_t:CDS:10 [Diversispora eburnea]|uniref:10982_t:CDS:1 n=1 Tax=Diversispora eburnea TaxID=1213867 RepID=A0A9N9BCY5_9GLOM|nr:10982_t:CDS:10 [Diversispora eburnea]